MPAPHCTHDRVHGPRATSHAAHHMRQERSHVVNAEVSLAMAPTSPNRPDHVLEFHELRGQRTGLDLGIMCAVRR